MDLSFSGAPFLEVFYLLNLLQRAISPVLENSVDLEAAVVNLLHCVQANGDFDGRVVRLRRTDGAERNRCFEAAMEESRSPNVRVIVWLPCREFVPCV